MKIIKKIAKWFLFLLSGIVAAISIILLIIQINSDGVQEPFLDAQGKVLPNSIAMHEDRVINGAPQRLTIRGKDMNNPVLLRVHGGPGSPFPVAALKIFGVDLEDLFTVCYWDQRGSGLAYKGNIPDSTITLNHIVDDGLEVANYLREKFNKDKIYIEGISWGTTVSAFMVQKNPELFKAYIGLGQMANQPLSEQISYDYVMQQAQKHKDTQSINELQRIGRPPYPNKTNVEMAEACDVERIILVKYVPPKITPSFKDFKRYLLDNGLTLKEKYISLQNPETYYPAYKLMWPTCFNSNLLRDVPEWEIPVFIIQGEEDYFTDTSLAKQYFDSLKAPTKMWFLIENATHNIPMEQPEKYRSIYISEILKK